MRAGRKILIVDDDVALRQSLAEQLELNDEFVCVECGTAAQALEAARKERFDKRYAQPKRLATECGACTVQKL